MPVGPPTTCWAISARGRSFWEIGPTTATRGARLVEQGAWANVKPMPNRTIVPAFSAFLYKYRNLVERFFSKIKHFRAVATRYDKDPENFLASVKLAAVRVWLRTL